jgi:hypothetical protein
MNAESLPESRDTLLIAGGIALMVFGAGLILAHPTLRRAVVAGLTPLLPELQNPMGSGLSGVNAVLPDVERYLKLRAM